MCVARVLCDIALPGDHKKDFVVDFHQGHQAVYTKEEYHTRNVFRSWTLGNNPQHDATSDDPNIRKTPVSIYNFAKEGVRTFFGVHQLYGFCDMEPLYQKKPHEWVIYWINYSIGTWVWG